MGGCAGVDFGGNGGGSGGEEGDAVIRGLDGMGGWEGEGT